MLKAFAIFLVVLGHTLQYGYNYGNNDFYSNYVWAIIYSFHMPLFIMLSGFFASSSLKDSFLVMLEKKISRIWLPAYLWLFIALVLGGALCAYNKSTIYILANYFPPVYNIFWFINALIFCYIIFYCSKKIFKNDIVSSIISSILMILVPFGYINNTNFMLPFFWFGYFFYKYEYRIYKYRKKILCISFIVFIILCAFWTGRFTVYKYPIIISPIQSINYYVIIIYRYAIGLFGSVFFWTCFMCLKNWNKYKCISKLTKCGQYTLIIYILNIICCEIYSRSSLHFFNYHGNLLFYNTIAVFISILFISIIMSIVFILNKFILTRKYLLGKI